MTTLETDLREIARLMYDFAENCKREGLSCVCCGFLDFCDAGYVPSKIADIAETAAERIRKLNPDTTEQEETGEIYGDWDAAQSCEESEEESEA